jgi:hypothetical protein
MATVWLCRRDWMEGALPRRCVRCGGRATETVEMDFFGTLLWGKPATYLMGLAWGREADATARVPTCDRHRLHWARRRWIILAAVALVLAALACVTAHLAFFDEDGFADARAINAYLLMAISPTGAFLFVLYFAYCIAGVRAVEVHEDGIRLTNVHESFRDACERQALLGDVDVEGALSASPFRPRGDADVTRRREWEPPA